MTQLALLLTFVSGIVALSAQVPAPAPAAPTFEVASVRPNSSDEPPSLALPPSGAVVATNVPLQNLIINAHGVPAFRVVGAPDWIERERFDIAARPPDGADPGQVLSMMRALLADRFNLRVHRETREMPIYTLVLARHDGRLGPNMKPAGTDCSTIGSATPLPPSPDSPCAGLMGVGPAGGTIVSIGQPLRRLTSALSMAVSRTVIDRTGLEGPFDVRLRWSADVSVGPAQGDTPSIFTALQEQLGLRLESTRGPVEVLVIDSVERPTPD